MHASDPFLFEWARDSGFEGLISVDRDFVRLAEELGPPPKVIRVERCDVPSAVVERLLWREAMRIHEFFESTRAILILRVGAEKHS